MPKRGPRYTPEEARARIYDLARQVALGGVDLVIALDKYPIESAEVERRFWAFSGQVGFLSRLLHTVWKYEGLKKAIDQLSV